MEWLTEVLSNALGNMVQDIVYGARRFLGEIGIRDADWWLFAICAAALLVLWVMLRRPDNDPEKLVKVRDKARVKAETKLADPIPYVEDQQANQSQHQTEEEDGPWNQPFELFKGRPGWLAMPDAFLWELVACLQTVETITDFIEVAERKGLVRKRMRKIAKHPDPRIAMKEVAAEFLRLGIKDRYEGQIALPLARLLDPKNPEIVLAVAKNYFASDRYEDALPLLEEGMSLCQRILDAAEGAPPADGKVKRQIGDLQKMQRKSAEMYEVCLKQATPQPI